MRGLAKGSGHSPLSSPRAEADGGPSPNLRIKSGASMVGTWKQPPVWWAKHAALCCASAAQRHMHMHLMPRTTLRKQHHTLGALTAITLRSHMVTALFVIPTKQHSQQRMHLPLLRHRRKAQAASQASPLWSRPCPSAACPPAHAACAACAAPAHKWTQPSLTPPGTISTGGEAAWQHRIRVAQRRCPASV